MIGVEFACTINVLEAFKIIVCSINKKISIVDMINCSNFQETFFHIFLTIKSYNNHLEYFSFFKNVMTQALKTFPFERKRDVFPMCCKPDGIDRH